MRFLPTILCENLSFLLKKSIQSDIKQQNLKIHQVVN